MLNRILDAIWFVGLSAGVAMLATLVGMGIASAYQRDLQGAYALGALMALLGLMARIWLQGRGGAK